MSQHHLLQDLGEQPQQRAETADRLRAQGIDPYPPRAERTHTAAEVVRAFEAAEAAGADPATGSVVTVPVTVVGRIVSVRAMGKATFAHIQDGSGRLQVYFKQNLLGTERYALLQDLDIGDFIQVPGPLFRTRTGEITVQAQDLTLLAKSLHPLPEKWHGLRDVELRYRQRYADLIANEDVRHIFGTRARLVTVVRRFLDERSFLEVETPILQPLYGGATANPFVTHHQALDRELYLRIAVELYLKRLIVGGFERVYEIGKDFRNEGIDLQHNPEFTMLECYQAYADYTDMMTLVEDLFQTVAGELADGLTLTYQGQAIDLTPPWPRVPLRQAIQDATGIDYMACADKDGLRRAINERQLEIPPQPTWAKLVDKLFGKYVLAHTVQPTFFIDYPLALSPLAKKKPGDPAHVERFQPIIAGLELGNAFTELNDPLDQLARFQDQSQQRAAGDQEAQPLDEDFVLALMYGMPPTGGLGIGIDRMTMLFTDQASIREVILFPQLRTK
ncbi:MAG: lysine--tRNA ligase [Chloroflexi bacterium]|nr:lysine--tRNA ligase [Chloroflexota bacterium]